MPDEFHPFPQAHVDQAEARANANKPYHSPHHPNNKPRIAASGIADAVQQAYQQPAIPSFPTVPVESPTAVTPVSEPEGVSLELPSRFALYDFKDVYARPFKGRNLSKLVRAKEEESTLHLVEAVSSVLSTTGSISTGIGFYLTPADFYFVLYWLRINSFTKTAFVHNTVCTNEQHLKDVQDKKVAPDTLKHAEIIHKSTLQTIMLDTMPDPEAFTIDYPDVSLKVPLMLDAVEMTEDPLLADPEFAFAAQIATCLATPNPMSLRERIAIVEDMSADDIDTAQRYEKAVSKYGIVEQVKWSCKTCGAHRTDKIELDAHSFFPSAA